MGKLDGQVAIVTGGGTGIGQGIALAYAEAGAKVVICGRRLEPLVTTLEMIQQKAGQGLMVQADVSKGEDVEKLVKATVDSYGTVDILVNNAAIGRFGSVHEHSIEVWDEVMAINLRGPFLMARAVLPIMRQRHRGHILNISSDVGIEYILEGGAYCVSKHALNALSMLIQKENQEMGIRVDTICPGMVITEMSAIFSLNHENCMLPEDIADLALWLVTRGKNVKISLPIMIQTMESPWKT